MTPEELADLAFYLEHGYLLVILPEELLPVMTERWLQEQIERRRRAIKAESPEKPE